MEKSARDQLAIAHVGMTPAEIAEHALCLAQCVESADEAKKATAEVCRDLIAGYENAVNQFGQLQMVVRRIASLNAARRYRDARKLAAELAAVKLVTVKMPLAPVHVPAGQAWPDIFSPKGSK